MRILLVDDDDGSRRIIHKVLTSLGHDVVCARDGREAWEAFSATPFPVVITDLRMPGISGLELLRRIKASGRDCHVVIITGYGDVASAVQAFRSEACDYLEKPVHIREFEEVLGKLTLKAAQSDPAKRPAEPAAGALLPHPGRPPCPANATATVTGDELLAELLVCSDHMRFIQEQALTLHAARDIPVVIQGETGTGKEFVARLIHCGESARRRPFVDVNCAAISQTLFESELFGYEGGAFTNARPEGQPGKFELADGGTIFLDEIGEMGADLQAKLLRVLESREFRRVGGSSKISADVRVICATNRDLRQMVEDGLWRADLYYRLNVATVRLRPLRERRDEIRPLAELFLHRAATLRGKSFRRIHPDAVKRLHDHSWPGNIRELRNVVTRAALFNDGDELTAEHLAFLPAPAAAGGAADNANVIVLSESGYDFEGLERRLIADAYLRNDRNQSRTARFLGISRGKLITKLKQLGLCQ